MVSQAGGRLTPNGDTLIVEALAPLSPNVMALLRQHKVALLALLRQTPGMIMPRTEIPALVPIDDGALNFPRETDATIPRVGPTQDGVLALPEAVLLQSGHTYKELSLLRQSAARNPAAFAEKVRIMYQLKYVLGGSLIALEQAAGPVSATPYQTPPSACYACGSTRCWQASHGAVVCALCHPPPDISAVVEWLDSNTALKGDSHEPQ
jgi:hypothetical protein